MFLGNGRDSSGSGFVMFCFQAIYVVLQRKARVIPTKQGQLVNFMSTSGLTTLAPSTQNFQIIGIWLLHAGPRRKWPKTTRRACVQRATCCSQSRVFARGALAPNSSYLLSSQCQALGLGTHQGFTAE